MTHNNRGRPRGSRRGPPAPLADVSVLAGQPGALAAEIRHWRLLWLDATELGLVDLALSRRRRLDELLKVAPLTRKAVLDVKNNLNP